MLEDKWHSYRNNNNTVGMLTGKWYSYRYNDNTIGMLEVKWYSCRYNDKLKLVVLYVFRCFGRENTVIKVHWVHCVRSEQLIAVNEAVNGLVLKMDMTLQTKIFQNILFVLDLKYEMLN